MNSRKIVIKFLIVISGLYGLSWLGLESWKCIDFWIFIPSLLLAVLAEAALIIDFVGELLERLRRNN